MRRLIGIFVIGMLSFFLATATGAQNFVPPTQLHLTYPPLQHKTTSDRLFFIGTAPKDGKVSINGNAIERSDAGHFAPSLPLAFGENKFEIKYVDATGDRRNERQINVKVLRESRITLPPKGIGFIQESLFPTVDIARQPNERICFDAIATPNATALVRIGDREIPLLPRRRNIQLPPNSSVLTGNNEATSESPSGYFRGCTTFETASKLGQPEYEMRIKDQSGDRVVKQKATGKVEILSAQNIQVAEVTAIAADARTGASTDFSRLTPLPKGVKAVVTGLQGDWLRLDYGGWVRKSMTKLHPAETPPPSIVRSINTKRVVNKANQKDNLNNAWTEVTIPLEVPVPIAINQGDRVLTLTLYNVTAQTDTILIDPESIINKLDWAQTEPNKVTYTISLKPKQQWGYKVRYQGTNLILSLKHPPILTSNTSVNSQPLQGVKILVDAGHGSSEDLGARGPTGYPEKDVTLITSKLFQTELQNRGAIVIMTRTDDSDVLLEPRVDKINQEEPTLAISIHYNALPDNGDAINTSGVASFWYNPQAQDFAKFINTYVVKNLNRADYGVYWNNLALVRPTVAPSVLLELGFMINPVEFEWIIDPQQQKLLAKTLADGVTEWILNAAK
ncbi:N-acetylmuramoyl-L-alanine amidase [Phormidium tenue]|uniref:N-acetylmuramoyl-L-alanine amidase n=1 Tax=Phormidium tenue FACHB-1050 TaxID=2692857 RepID=A0ABR8CCQ5_9CYAN|nr:N-acetylmuramoyl-L-alanine amidase [Phormidium tenue]MBD2318082.1 N-acetylmuramoyl-L-alanine amidase [Phormidium tenue FACHB-1050]